ncbi:MrcB family domain-containing protein [Pseudomonas sp. CLCA07]
MAIPRVDRARILEAIREFDTILLPTDEWRAWESNGSQVWALVHDGKHYPPKKIISLATGTSVNEFSGGPETNGYLDALGFDVIKLRPLTLDSVFQRILERYDEARKTIGFAGNHEIKELFTDARRILRDSPNVKSYPNINVVASYGKGNWATIPWVSLLDRRETDTTQAGTYIVYLFEEGGNGLYVKLAQGVTAATKELGANAEAVLGQRADEVRHQCMHLAEQGFDLSGRTNLHTEGRLGRLYEASTIASKHYSRNAIPSETELLADLDVLLQAYDNYVAQRAPSTPPIRDPRPLALIGTWRDVRADAPAIQAEIAQNGGLASWWSFPIKVESLPRLLTPFNLYAYIGNGTIGARIRVAEYRTSRGNTGMESPWPELTSEELRGKTRREEGQSFIFKTWFRIDKLEILDPPQSVSNFDIAHGLSTPESLLNQSTFGYVYDQLAEPTASGPEPIELLPPKLEPTKEWLIAQTGLELHVLEEMLAALCGDLPQVILSGPPGTGKTWVARALAHYLARGNEQNIRFVQFHPSYSYESFIEGLRPVSRGGSISFEVTKGLVLSCVRDMEKLGALNDHTQDHVIVIDEANRANLPKVLGELMFLFEYRQHPVHLPYSGEFSLPENLRFIATMNTADRSIRSIDVALRRRFEVFELGPDPEILRKHYESGRPSLTGLVDGFIHLNKMLETELDRHHTIGHTFFMRERMDALTLRQIWNRRVYPLIEEFFFDQPELAKEFRVEKFWYAANGN